MKYVNEFRIMGESLPLIVEKYISKSNSTKRLMLSSIKSYLIFSNSELAKEITLPKKEIKVSDYITYDEYKELLERINDKTKMGFQKRVILRLLFETGVRSSELLWITRGSIHKNRIKIRGKGNKERYINISDWLHDELSRYLKTIQTERIFPFSYKNLYDKINRLDKNRNITPHMFRHGYARYCNEQGISIYEISISMGHSSIDTTALYINKKSEDVDVSSIF